MITESNALNLAQQWLDAWNNHDLEEILSHYAEEIELTSPFVAKLTGNFVKSLQGKEALRDYFARGLENYPDLKFVPLQILIGVDSIVIYYRSVQDLLAAEFMLVNEAGLITKIVAHYSNQ
jgi:ketosteroid isomerase-like protein